MITSCSRCLLPCDTTWKMGAHLVEISHCCRAVVFHTWVPVPRVDTGGHNCFPLENTIHLSI